jgi:Rrf2 family protein
VEVFILKLTQESEYAIKIVLYLVKMDEGKLANAREISEAENLSVKFALKILRRLCKVKIVESFRGIKGGYKLKKSPSKINIKDIVEAMQGELFISPSLKGVRRKEKIADDVINEFLFEIQDDIRNRFTTTTFEKLISNSKITKS